VPTPTIAVGVANAVHEILVPLPCCMLQCKAGQSTPGADLGFVKGQRTTASTEHEPVTGVWGRSPSGVLVGVSGAKPLEAESFLSIFIQRRGQK